MFNKFQFKNLSLRKKILLIVTILLMFDIFSFGLMIYNNKASKKDSLMVDCAGRNRMLSQRMAALASVSLSDDLKNATKAKKELKKAVKFFKKNVSVLKNGGHPPKTDPGEKIDKASNFVLPHILKLEKFFIKHNEYLQVILTQPKYTFQNHSSLKEFNPKVKDAALELQERLLKGKMLRLSQKLVDAYTDQANQNQEKFVYLLMIILVVNIVMVFMVFVLINRYIVIPIKGLREVTDTLGVGDFSKKVEVKYMDDIGKVSTSLNVFIENISKVSEFADHIGQNKLDAQLEVLGEKDSLGKSLLEMRTNLLEIKDEDSKRNWISEGLAKFTVFLRDTSDEQHFYDTILSNLIRYIHANQGYLYVLNDEDENEEFMEIKTVYAYGKQRYLEEKNIIRYQQGLVGQAWFDKEPLFFTEIPADFVNITSGMGEATPTCVFIIPLMINEKVYGAIEIASFEPLASEKIEFVTKLSETIASTISTVKVNAKTKLLLNQSQQQTEEMRAQEEEIRQNIEEMQATQAEMTRMQRHLQEDKIKLENELREKNELIAQLQQN